MHTFRDKFYYDQKPQIVSHMECLLQKANFTAKKAYPIMNKSSLFVKTW